MTEPTTQIEGLGGLCLDGLRTVARSPSRNLFQATQALVPGTSPLVNHVFVANLAFWKAFFKRSVKFKSIWWPGE